MSKSMTDILIDGAMGEGGGQIVRPSLSLAMLTGRSFTIENVRAGRKKPGLMRQHLTAVRAASEICSAAVAGDSVGSQRFTFKPGQVQGGDYNFAVGTAGSTTLVLQTVLPALLGLGKSANVGFEGGTHNPFAPPYTFLKKSFVPVLQQMGADIDIDLKKPGYYPRGGGRVELSVRPGKRPFHFPDLTQTRVVQNVWAEATVSGLPRSIAEREVDRIGKKLGLLPERLVVKEEEAEFGPGNVVHIYVECENITAVFTGFGRVGISSEKVADHTAGQVQKYLDVEAPVDRHLADQLLLPMAIAGNGKFNTGPISEHTSTNIEVIEKFFDVKFHIEELEKGIRQVVCEKV